MSNIYMQTNKNRSYLTEDIVPFKGEVVAYRKQQNDLIEQRYLYIYKITCLKDNRVYIGKRIAPVDCEDPLLDNYKGSGYVIKTLKEKYDWYQDFKFEIIQFCENENALNEAEKYHIAQARKQYGDLCCNIDDGGAGLSPAKAKRLWEDPEYRQARSEQKTEMNLRMWQDPYYREMWSQMTKERMSKPEFREMSRQIMSQNWEDPEWREAQRQRSIQRWQNPEYRTKMSELASKNIKKYWEEHPERKEAFREETKKRWENPEYRQQHAEKMSAQSKEWWSDPKNREENGRKSREAWERNPQRYEDQSRRMVAINEQKWSTQEARDEQAKTMSKMVRSKWEDGTMLKVHGKRVRVNESFTCPRNGKYFEEGTIFDSIKDAALAIGMPSGPVFNSNVLHHAKHPGEWIARVNGKDVHVTSFTVLEKDVDDEE